ncbi:MAG: type II toxin-antitoxin system RelE/ParE family toxin [Acidobacteria bacterium]|nr:type II toxin-antitoxin system RelE/ParE family toxin [Acidobacteriota bacterium]
MIRSLRHRGLKRLFESGDASRLNPALLNRIQDILTLLDAAGTLAELNLPGYRLHPLKGDWKGFWSITVSGNWRVVFRFEDGNALDVDLVDYH